MNNLRTYTLKLILVFITIHLCSAAMGKAPYSVYYADRGVILLSAKHGEILNPVRGIEVYEEDSFVLKDERYVIKIKDTSNGEIFSFSGKGAVSPKEIVNTQRLRLFDRFMSFFTLIAKENGFNTAPVLTSQCVSKKGGNNQQAYELSLSVASQVKKAIADGSYSNVAFLTEVLSEEDSLAFYRIQNQDSIDYAFVLYTVEKDGEINSHNRIILMESNGYRSDGIAFIPLPRNMTIDLSYFTFDATEIRTCYVILFKQGTLYQQRNNGKYSYQINWDYVSKELKYSGDCERIILLE